jgi:hypothetical protein
MFFDYFSLKSHLHTLESVEMRNLRVYSFRSIVKKSIEKKLGYEKPACGTFSFEKSPTAARLFTQFERKKTWLLVAKSALPRDQSAKMRHYLTAPTCTQ